MTIPEFYIFVLSSLRVLGENYSNTPDVHWTYIFTFEIFIFGNFIQKINFEWSQFQKVGVALPVFWSF